MRRWRGKVAAGGGGQEEGRRRRPRACLESQVLGACRGCFRGALLGSGSRDLPGHLDGEGGVTYGSVLDNQNSNIVWSLNLLKQTRAHPFTGRANTWLCLGDGKSSSGLGTFLRGPFTQSPGELPFQNLQIPSACMAFPHSYCFSGCPACFAYLFHLRAGHRQDRLPGLCVSREYVALVAYCALMLCSSQPSVCHSSTFSPELCEVDCGLLSPRWGTEDLGGCAQAPVAEPRLS